MATSIQEIKVKCFQCQVILYARVKVDYKTGKTTKYVNIGGGQRRTAPNGRDTTYCDFCAKKLDNKRPKVQSFLKGERVKHKGKPEWGVGQVLSDSSGTSVRIYFTKIGEKKILLKHAGQIYDHLTKVSGAEADQPLLDVLNRICWNSSEHHHVYIVELKKEVMKNYKFNEANQGFNPKYPCVYVGMTGLTPEERFENHKNGYKSSYYPHKFGKKLLPDLYKCFNPMSNEDAKKLESELAEALRQQGFAVWQN